VGFFLLRMNRIKLIKCTNVALAANTQITQTNRIMNKKEIKQFLKDKPAVSKRGLCREAGITPQYLNMILRDERPLTENVINKIKPVLHKYGLTKKV